MKTLKLFHPQISVRAGRYTFTQGVELEVVSSKSSYFDWAKVRFTKQYQKKINLAKKDPASIELGYSGDFSRVFSGFLAKPYNEGAEADEIYLKDEMLLLEETIISNTFLSTTPQEMIGYFLAQAGITNMKLSGQDYPERKLVPIRQQNIIQAINTVQAAWNISNLFYFSDGVFYWGERPAQEKVYTFEQGVNILTLTRFGGVWMLETASAPFVKHSHKINVLHEKISGELEVQKVVSKTNDAGFIRTYIYF